MTLTRRQLIQGSAAAAIAGLPSLGQAQGAAAAARRFEPRPGTWRSFELTLDVSVADHQGTTKLWLPLPDLETGYQRSLGHSFSGNASVMQVVADAPRGVRMLYAEFPESVKAPSLQLVSRLQTQSRAVDWSRKAGRVGEDPEVLRANLAPTELIPTDGIVRKTALEATRGARTDLEKTRAIYRWVVANAHREPKVRGCGTGDVRTMLETGNLGGKCADLNAIFVGLCRSVGVPARDVYGLRLVPSAFGYRELGANPAGLKGAQHCRAEVFLQAHGWVAMDPADVLKVMRQETPEWIKDPAHPLVAPVNEGLFGGWEGNWVGYNTAHDLMLPGSAGKASLPFLMYPQGENRSGRFDELAPDSFKYSISAKEI
ncbi:transglutaminase domain-containing protein [Roseateles sp. DAIF2]|uniref:transglutaminase-like domain-containing protein n=1 Tax=Roseateles sp. DAIF2 TaxID=2714952 RepID=UPI0018A32592|nr:transglutaminase-like domain-containing protein [Roseateles sp. DAIF2]QPF74790.1 transglutaminase domain-containing protein [Roseateles sp. DAIF2]